MRIERLGSDGLRIETCCKLNLFLDVLGRRGDGFHELLSLFHEIAWGDVIEIRTSPERDAGFHFSCDDPGLSPGEGNLCVRAARALLAAPWARPLGGIAIDLNKRTPMGAGLGGGSADAASVLVGLAQLMGVFEERREEIAALALELGSDCPFFLAGGTRIGRGRGELLQGVATPLFQGGTLAFCLVLPALEISTPIVFRRFAEAPDFAPQAARFQRLLGVGRAEELAAACYNRLQAVVFESHPELGELAARLSALWERPVCMSGSGSTLFACFPEERAASAAERVAAAAFPEVSFRAVTSAGGDRRGTGAGP